MFAQKRLRKSKSKILLNGWFVAAKYISFEEKNGMPVSIRFHLLTRCWNDLKIRVMKTKIFSEKMLRSNRFPRLSLVEN